MQPPPLAAIARGKLSLLRVFQIQPAMTELQIRSAITPLYSARSF